MAVFQSIAAALALIGTVLALEGVTRGGTKQLVAGLLFATAAALTFSFGDAVPALNLQIIDQLPRWRDVAHPLPEPALTPAPPKTDATPPKIQTTAPNNTSARPVDLVINFRPTYSPNGLPRFLAVYPRKKFMDKTDWNAPPLNKLNVMYDALTVHDWEKANAYAEAALGQLKVADIENKNYYEFHITWVQGIAKMETGNFAQAIGYFNDASKFLLTGNSGADDVMRFQIDREIVNIYAGMPNSILMRDLMPDLLDSQNTHMQEIALLHYARALRAAKNADMETSNHELEDAKNLAWQLLLANQRDAATRMTIIFSEPFGAPKHAAVAAPVAEQTAPAQLPTNQETSTKQFTTSPHFFAVYPRQKFMPDVNWSAPAVPAIASLYDAMEASEWQKALDISSVAMRQALAQKDQRDKSSYVGHILWLKAIATFESGDHDLANQLMQKARIYINEAEPDLEDQRHLEIDVGLFAELSGDFDRFVLGDLLQTFERNPANHSHELALLRYEWALRAKESGELQYAEMNIGAARSEAAELDAQGHHDEAARLRSVFGAQFPNN